MYEIFTNRVFVSIGFGYGAFTFLVGGMSVWAPDYLEEYYSLNHDAAVFAFGGITVVTGVVSTVIGSLI